MCAAYHCKTTAKPDGFTRRLGVTEESLIRLEVRNTAIIIKHFSVAPSLVVINWTANIGVRAESRKHASDEPHRV